MRDIVITKITELAREAFRCDTGILTGISADLTAWGDGFMCQNEAAYEASPGEERKRLIALRCQQQCRELIGKLPGLSDEELVGILIRVVDHVAFERYH